MMADENVEKMEMQSLNLVITAQAWMDPDHIKKSLKRNS
jgi:hypothetical protein